MSSQTRQQDMLTRFFIFASLTVRKLYFSIVLMYMYLIISESEHLFIVFKCSLYIFVSSHDFFPFLFHVGLALLPLNAYNLPLCYIYVYMGFLGGKLIKNQLPMQETEETGVWSLGQEDLLK